MINKYLVILFLFNTALLQEKIFWDFQLKIIESKRDKVRYKYGKQLDFSFIPEQF